MGTYAYIVLKGSVPDEKIKAINRLLADRGGLPIDVHNGVEYGSFCTDESVTEDVRFMNEDPEGLSQAPHWPRPISVEQLENNWPFTKRRQFCCTVGTQDEIRWIAIAVAWVEENEDLIDKEESSRWRREDFDSILSSPLHSYVKGGQV